MIYCTHKNHILDLSPTKKNFKSSLGSFVVLAAAAVLVVVVVVKVALLVVVIHFVAKGQR